MGARAFLALTAWAAVLFVIPTADGARYTGDRPGQLRRSWFSSYARKPKAPDPEALMVLVAPGSRAALQLHDQDVVKTKRSKISRSISLRSRSASVTTRSPSVRGKRNMEVVMKTKEMLDAYVEDPKRSLNELIRINRLSGLRPSELPPSGLWTAKNRPQSLLPELKKKQKKVLAKAARQKAEVLRKRAEEAQSKEKKTGKKRSKSKRSKSSKRKET